MSPQKSSYNTTNSGLASDAVLAIAVDEAGNTWFGTYGGGVGVLKGDGTWQTYNTSNSELPSDSVLSIAVDAEGAKWFGLDSGGPDNISTLKTDGTWHTYSFPAEEGFASYPIYAIAIDGVDNKWFGGNDGTAGVAVLYGGTDYPITDNAQWLSPARYQATYDINTLIPRDTYSITVRGAAGTDGIEIAPNNAYTFTVDYAGAIGDTTPPPAPTVLACGAASADTLSATWSASDPDSSIDRYRYAISTAAGGADVVNWTETTDTSFLRANLNLTAGQTYYVSVKARNEGGLWSEAGVSSGVQAGSGTCPGVSFTANPVSGPATLNVQFTDTSTGTVDHWAWDFGDGITGTLQSPLHAYTTTGNYTVSLLVSGPGGSNWVVKPNFISVTGAITPPVAGFTASPLAGQPPLTVVFTDTSSGDINTWQWDFGDGQGNTTQNPTHIYSNTGSFTVSLTVTGAGGSDIETKPGYIIVSDNPVIANFTANPTSGQAPLTVHFSDASVGNITAWQWDFGDQTTGTLQIPGHTYTAPGIYTVSLSVSGPEGSDSLVRPNYISVTNLQFVYLPLVLKQ